MSFSSCQNGNAKLMISRLVPLVYFLSWEPNLRLKHPTLRFCFTLNVCFLLFKFLFNLVLSLFYGLQE